MRRFRHSIVAALMGVAPAMIAGAATAQDYPTKPITWIAPSSAGSGFDVVSRLIQPKMSEILGQPIVIQNIAGAGATVGAAKAAEADPDGYTILLVNSNHTAAEGLYKSLSYNLLTSFDPVVRFTTSYHVIVVKNDLEAKTLADLVAMAKAEPGKLNFASAGLGSVTFMCGELFKSAAGIDMAHIPYEGGGPALASVVAGETDVYLSPYSTAKPMIDDGKVRALAVTSKERFPDKPDLPTAAETVPGFEFASFYGLVVPKGTPLEIREKIRAALIKTIEDPAVKPKLAELGLVLLDQGPDEFAAYMKNEVETTKAAIQKAGIEPK